MRRRIIIGYDGLEHSEDALALGGLLAEVLDAEPVVVAVLYLPEWLMGPEDVETWLREAAEPIFEVARKRLAPLEVETRAIAGSSPAHALHDLAEEEAPLTIVVGSTRRGALGRVFIGGTGESLLSGAPCAIAVAPLGYAERDERRLVRIGVAADGSEESWSALDAAVSLVAELHGSLILLAVAEPLRSAYAGSTLLTPGDFEAASEQHFTRVLEEAAARAGSELSVEQRLLSGEPAEALAEAAKDLDLLVLGSRGYGPRRRALMGGVSGKLMRVAPCPLLVLPRGAGGFGG
ncbi:MAG: universal stress protein [Solirubrobacterales bacterium]